MVFNLTRIGLIVVFAYIATRAVGRALRALRDYSVKMMLKAGGGAQYEAEKHAETIAGVARKALFVLIWTIALIMALKEMNFDIRPLLAGAGVVGIAKSAEIQAMSNDDLKKIVTEGKGKMKPVKTVSGPDLDNVVAYVRSLKK